jgi:low affinity Fe/Cu permease
MDEIIRTTSGAQNMLLDLESMDAAKLEELRKVYEELAEIGFWQLIQALVTIDL